MATNTENKTLLQIQRMPDGGFVVGNGYRPEMFSSMLFASTDIGEALTYIRTAMMPDQRSK